MNAKRARPIDEQVCDGCQKPIPAANIEAFAQENENIKIIKSSCTMIAELLPFWIHRGGALLWVVSHGESACLPTRCHVVSRVAHIYTDRPLLSVPDVIRKIHCNSQSTPDFDTTVRAMCVITNVETNTWAVNIQHGKLCGGIDGEVVLQPAWDQIMKYYDNNCNITMTFPGTVGKDLKEYRKIPPCKVGGVAVTLECVFSKPGETLEADCAEEPEEPENYDEQKPNRTLIIEPEESRVRDDDVLAPEMLTELTGYRFCKPYQLAEFIWIVLTKTELLKACTCKTHSG